jgi:DNA polymerase III delta prime subunit
MDDDSCDGGGFSTTIDDVSMLEAAKDEEEEDELTWRLDPEQSLSDWTVLTQDHGEVKPYHLQEYPRSRTV